MDLHIDGIDSNCWGCDEDATTYVLMGDGIRRYYCEECVSPLFRHATDAEDLDEHPRVIICSTCGDPTLKQHAPVNVCPECELGDEGHAEEVMSQIDEASREYAEKASELGSNKSISVDDEDGGE